MKKFHNMVLMVFVLFVLLGLYSALPVMAQSQIEADSSDLDWEIHIPNIKKAISRSDKFETEHQLMIVAPETNDLIVRGMVRDIYFGRDEYTSEFYGTIHPLLPKYRDYYLIINIDNERRIIKFYEDNEVYEVYIPADRMAIAQYKMCGYELIRWPLWEPSCDKYYSTIYKDTDVIELDEIGSETNTRILMEPDFSRLPAD